jgi:antitoxin ParD1/3/4
MATMNISLPDSMRAFVEERVTEGGYSTASEYLRELIRADLKRRAEERLEALLLEALDSPSREMTPEDWEEIRRQCRERIQQPTREEDS